MADFKNVAPLADFDWDAFENGAVAGQSQEETAKAYDDTLGRVNDNEVVEGTVISINKREVVVNIGYKSDGIIPVSEFRYNPELKVGDKVEVYVENQEDKRASSFFPTRRLAPARAGNACFRLTKPRKLSTVTSSAARRAV